MCLTRLPGLLLESADEGPMFRHDLGTVGIHLEVDLLNVTVGSVEDHRCSPGPSASANV